MAHEGLASVASSRPVGELVARLEAALAAKGITLFARIDHAAGAASVGMNLRPMTVLIFGNPRAGTPLMLAEPRTGLDLPLRVLAWQDADGHSWLSYHDMRALAACHGIDPDTTPAVATIAALLDALTREAAA